MDGDFFSTCLSEDDDVQFDDDHDPDGYAEDGERCGICMEVVIDRGVLDCCEHWFCFLCIDNWATITNLCPLCQNEFQSITCVPVHDTIGSSKDTDESGFRDDDWSIEEKNSTLSFPSYYIDENSVICLDGDGCKLRSGVVSTSEEDMDTSIACDSCDLWYHAFCVGFDTNKASESTWFCPRCTGDDPHKSNGPSVNNSGDQLCLDRTEEGYCTESGISSKVSVSIVDTGETAVVVSMVTEKQWGESKEKSSNLEVGVVSGFGVGSLEGDPSISFIHQNSEVLGVGHSMSSESGMPNLGVSSKPTEELFYRVVDNVSFAEAEGKLETSIYRASYVKSEDDIVERDRDEEIPIVSPRKRKLRGCSAENIATTSGREMKNEVDTIRGSSKRSRTDETIEMNPSLETLTCSISDDSTRNLHSKAEFNNEKLRHSMQKGEQTDNVNLIQDPDRRHLQKVLLSNHAHEDVSEGGKESGRRVKKIMRRSTDGKDSSVILQKLREEIREAVQNKSTKDVDELFNPKLLEAFRAAVAGPNPVRQNLTSSALKMKKSFLQKGKVRENLTKKIYATSNGRWKRAWDRDCEIEFWKHRCFETSKPEKIDTLKSVLGLLRSSSEDPETGKLLAPHDTNPILSRLYLADTSIFPRKDDIRPVVALHEADTQHLSEKGQTSERSSSITSLLNPLGGSLKAESGPVKAHSPIVTHKGINLQSSLKQPNTYNGVSRAQLGSVTSQSSVSKPSSQREVVGQSDIKSDKRRWALEVLARKTAKPGQTTTSHEHLEDNTLFKGNYPILAQLPDDMRPTPMSIRRCKISMHVRQTQLYRLTEHLLKQANLPVIRRTAATELAVADAVNIEKGIAERSNSKLVYMNLCSQEVLRHLDCNATLSENATSLEPILPSDDIEEEHKNSEGVSDTTVEEALKNAGLLPESPPGSPRLLKDVLHGVDGASNNMKEDRPENVLEINSHPELGTSGGCGYAFDHEDHKNVDVHVVATNEVEEPKVNLISSPLTTVVAEKDDKSADNILAQSVENLPGSPSFIKGKTWENCLDSSIDLQLKESHSPKILFDSGSQEISTADCEEFVGLDTEPQIQSLAIGSSASEIVAEDGVNMSKDGVGDPVSDSENPSANHLAIGVPCQPSAEACSDEPSKPDETIKKEEKISDVCNSVSKKVEAFIKEHIRPLCKSGVITVEQYRWAVAKTTQKVMKYHTKDKNANFLIKEGENVKKLALQYLEGSQKNE